MNNPMTLPVSIVIPSADTIEAIDELLLTILRQDTLPSEILLIQSGNVFINRGFFENWSNYYGEINVRFQAIQVSQALPGMARNVGIRNARQPWIAFLDIGVLPKNIWLQELYKCMTQARADVVWGSCMFFSGDFLGRILCASSYGDRRTYPTLPGSLVKIDVFRKAGFFEERLRACEDLLWKDALVRHNIKEIYCKSACVSYSSFPRSIWSAMYKQYIYEQNILISQTFKATRVVGLLYLALSLIIIPIFPKLGFGSATFYIVFRGLIRPVLKSGIWWQSYPQLVVAPFILVLLDLSSIVGLMVASLGFSKYRLTET